MNFILLQNKVHLKIKFNFKKAYFIAKNLYKSRGWYDKIILENKVQKNLLFVLKKGQKETQYYLKFNKINNLIKDVADGDSAFVETSDKVIRSLLFDAIEMVDTYIGLE